MEKIGTNSKKFIKKKNRMKGWVGALHRIGIEKIGIEKLVYKK